MSSRATCASRWMRSGQVELQGDTFHRTLRKMGSYGDEQAKYQKLYGGQRRGRRELLDEFTNRNSMLSNYLKIALLLAPFSKLMSLNPGR